jgi:streptogramin lyase
MTGRRGGVRRVWGLAALAAVAVLAGSLATAPARTAFAAGVASVTDYPVPGGQPWGTAFDASGRVWVALPGCDPSPTCSKSTPPGKLALFDPGPRTWTTIVSLPAGYGQPLFVAVDGAGKVWFTMPVTNAIGRYDPVNATVRQWPVPTVSSGPWALAIDSNGKVWFTEHYVNKISAFTPATQTFKEVATPATNSNPYGITVDAANNVWFTENTDSVARIGRYTTAGVLKEYKIRKTATGGTGLTPHSITVDSAGKIWWSEGWVHGIGRLDPVTAVPGTNTAVSEYFYTPACGNCGSHTSGIAADHHGLIWLDDSLQNTFGSFPAAGGSFSFYKSPGSHPHDGLNVDAQDRIWFDEEFANRLAVATQSSTSTSSTTTSSTSTSSTTTTSTSTSSTTTSSTSTTTTSTSTTTTTVPGSGTVLGIDTFQRPDQLLWGNASDGQTWAGDANSLNAFSISGNTGQVANTGGNSYSAVLGPAAADAEAFVTGSISSFASSNFGDVLRWTDGNNWYKAYVEGANLVIQKKVSGVTTILASTPFTAAAGVAYTVHFRAVGSTLTANVWATSDSEPAGWMLTATDSTFASGYAGMRFLTQTGTATVTAFNANTT